MKIMISIINIILLVVLSCINLHSREVELTGAGASFPYPLYMKMFDIYNKEYGVRVNYQSIGSGGGQRQLLDKIVDFAGSDAYLTDEQLKKAGIEMLHVPICLGAVVVIYNLPEVKEIKFTPEIISKIFLGQIKKWNDASIKEINPMVKMPDVDIVVVHRSDGSGTTAIFTDYLAKVSDEWLKSVGKGTAVDWKVGVGGKGNEGVAGLVKNIKGAIGYVELIYAKQNNIPMGIIKNKAGKFVSPTIESVSVAANVSLPDDMRVSITDTEAEEGYPISGFTWIIVYKEQKYGNRSKEKAVALAKLLWWMTHQGQKYTGDLLYAPLSKEATKKAETIIKSMCYAGHSIL